MQYKCATQPGLYSSTTVDAILNAVQKYRRGHYCVQIVRKLDEFKKGVLSGAFLPTKNKHILMTVVPLYCD